MKKMMMMMMMIIIIIIIIIGAWGSVVVKTLRYYSVGLGIDSGGVSHWLPTEPCTLGSTQSLKMSTRDFIWGKGGRRVRLTTTVVVSNVKNLPGTPWATLACCGRPLPLIIIIKKHTFRGQKAEIIVAVLLV